MKPDFIWLVHPACEAQLQNRADKYNITLEKIISDGPRIVDTVYDHEYGLVGDVVSTPLLPKELIKRKNVMDQLKLIKEIIDPTVPVGLGGWWATVTRGGKLAREILDNPIIDGYTGTVNRIVEQVRQRVPIQVLKKVCIVGAGEVGIRVKVTLQCLGYICHLYDIRTIDNTFHISALKGNIDLYDIGVCCTTSTKDIIKVDDIPEGFIWIDDSYPHAIPGYEGRIDGGVYDNPKITSDWLVEDGKVYGCLMELINEARKCI